MESRAETLFAALMEHRTLLDSFEQVIPALIAYVTYRQFL